jgi:hypothetical protein
VTPQKLSEIAPLFKAELATVSFDAAKSGKIIPRFQDCEQIGSFEKSGATDPKGARRAERRLLNELTLMRHAATA